MAWPGLPAVALPLWALLLAIGVEATPDGGRRALLASLPFDCAQEVVLNETTATGNFQTVLGVPWSHISWLNPEVPADAAEVEGGTAICTENGPTPESVVPAPEPELPTWLPPWAAAAKRQTSVDGRCVQSTGLPAAPGYADAVLCGRDSPFSPVLAAALGGGLSPGCEPCVYSPAGDGAYRFDYDNRCWMQDSPDIATCARGGDAQTYANAAAGLLNRQQTFVNYLSSTTANAADLAPTFASDVAATYRAFLNSACGPKDLAQACYNLHQKLGRLLNEGFAANSTLEALKSLPPTDPLAPVQQSFADANRANDCQRAEATSFTTAACLCDDTQPYLACMAQATFEANTTLQALLASTFISVDPGSLKAEQQAVCTDVETSAQLAPLDTTNAADVASFLLGSNSGDPQRCCFVVPLAADAAITASVCLAPVQNATAEFLASPVTQAADYTIPSCGYEDPLAAYGTTGADALAGWPVGMQTKLCLEGGAAVEGLKALLPWFGPTVADEGGQFCVDTNVNGPVYFPLKALGLSSLQADGPTGAGVEYRLGGEMDYKVLDPAATQACISAAKSEVLNEVARCSAACLLKAWQFERLTWQVITGSDVFGWARGYPLLQPTVDPFTPECNDQTFFAGQPPPCPSPGLPVLPPAPAPAVEPPMIAPAPEPELLPPAPAPAVEPPMIAPAPEPELLPPAPAPAVEPPMIAPAPEPELLPPAPAPAVEPPMIAPAPEPELLPPAPAPEPAAQPPAPTPAPEPAVQPPLPAEAPAPEPATASPPLVAPAPAPAVAPEVLPPMEAPSPQPVPEVPVEPPALAPAPEPTAEEMPGSPGPAPAPAPEPATLPPLLAPAPEPALAPLLPAPAPAPGSPALPPLDALSPGLEPAPEPAGFAPLEAPAPEPAMPPADAAQASASGPAFGVTSESPTPSPALAPEPSALGVPAPAPSPLQGTAPSADLAPTLAPAPAPSIGPAPDMIPVVEQAFSDAAATLSGTSSAVSQGGLAFWGAAIAAALSAWLMLLP